MSFDGVESYVNRGYNCMEFSREDFMQEFIVAVSAVVLISVFASIYSSGKRTGKMISSIRKAWGKLPENVYENKHFEEEITDDHIKSDYRIKDGRAASRNAIKLLKLMGFDEKIVSAADKAVEDFEKQNRWKSCQDS